MSLVAFVIVLLWSALMALAQDLTSPWRTFVQCAVTGSVIVVGLHYRWLCCG